MKHIFTIIILSQIVFSIPLYEVYENQAALDKHRTMSHFTKWRETVNDWFDGEPERKSVTTVFPTDNGWRKQKPHLLDE